MARCKACGAEISFVRMKDSGKLAPVDVRKACYEDPNGKIRIVTADGRVSRGRDAVIFAPGKTRGWPSHWASCPFADRFRKGKDRE